MHNIDAFLSVEGCGMRLDGDGALDQKSDSSSDRRRQTTCVMKRSKTARKPQKRLLQQIVGSMIVRYPLQNGLPKFRAVVRPESVALIVNPAGWLDARATRIALQVRCLGN